MKKSSLILAGLLIAASVTPAMAVGPYLGVGTGMSIVHDSDVSMFGFSGRGIGYDLGYAFTLSGGYNFDPVRLEAELAYKNSSIKGTDSDLTVKTFMLNGYYDFKVQSPITPYVGLGIGVLNGKIGSGDDTTFGYQIALGGAYKINKNVALDLSYRFQGAAPDLSNNGVDISYRSSNLLAGVRYSF